MEIRCVKCRFKYDVTINGNQSEATVICPRCGAIQKAVPPHEATETTAGGSSQQPQTDCGIKATPASQATPAPPAGSGAQEDYRRYMPDNGISAHENHQETPAPDIEKEPRGEKAETAANTAAAPVPPKKDQSCAKKFALGCVIVAVLAILAIAIIGFAGKKLFNSVSSPGEEEKEHVETNSNNVTAQAAEDGDAQGFGFDDGNNNEDAGTEQNAQQKVTNTGGEGNGNTSVKEETQPTEEERDKAESDVAKAGGNYKCSGTMDGGNVKIELNVTSGGFVSGKLTYGTKETTLDIIGDKSGDNFSLTASNDRELIKMTLKKEGRAMKGTAKKGMRNMPVSVTF